MIHTRGACLTGADVTYDRRERAPRRRIARVLRDRAVGVTRAGSRERDGVGGGTSWKRGARSGVRVPRAERDGVGGGGPR